MKSEIVDRPNNHLLSSSENLLQDLRSGRRLQQVTVSIENFVSNQLARIEAALEYFERAEQLEGVLQRKIHDFEQKRCEWEQMRQVEEQRLFEAGNKLIQGWKQLEQERHFWTQQDSVSNQTSRF